MKQYQTLYDAIKASAEIEATSVFNLPQKAAQSYIDTYTKNMYLKACKLIKTNQKTEAELIAVYQQ